MENKRQAMHRSIRNALAITAVTIAISSPAVGQEEGLRPTKTAVIEVSPKPGQALKFEAAVKRHMKWAKEQNSTWGWDVFAIATGRVGNYLFVSRNHPWGDFDENQAFQKRAKARWQAKVARHVAFTDGGIYRLLVDHSRVPKDADSYPLAAVSFFSVLPTSTRRFLRTHRHFADAMKTHPSAPPAFWYQQVSGGDQGTFLNMRLFKSWEDWPNEASARAMSESMDPKKTAGLVRELGEVLLREQTSVIAARPDLSLIPH